MYCKVFLFTTCVCMAVFYGNEATGIPTILKAKALLATKAKLGLVKHAIITKPHYVAAPAPRIYHPHPHQVVHEKIGSLWQSAKSAATIKANKIQAGISALNPIPYLKRLYPAPVHTVAVPVYQLHPNTAIKHYNVIEYYPVKPIEIPHEPVHIQAEPAKPYPPATASRQQLEFL